MAGYTHIKPGEEVEVVARQYLSFAKGAENHERMLELVKLSIPELEQLKAASMEAEKAIYAKFAPITTEWTAQAGETVMLQAAMQYLSTPQVTHTSNQRVKGEYDWYEMSNMVYKLHWRITDLDWKRRPPGTPIPYDLSWYLTYNTPRNPDNTSTGRQLAGQERKHFPDKDSMEKYLEGRIKAYAHLFTEISPPIPKGQEGRFSVNGVLLPGYTVEVPEPTIEEQVESLLSFVEDSDLVPPDPPSERPSSKSPAHKPKKHAPTR